MAEFVLKKIKELILKINKMKEYQLFYIENKIQYEKFRLTILLHTK